jgi:hypothetical protein
MHPPAAEHNLPKVKLSRAQLVRMIVVGVFAAFSLARVLPDAIRVVQPLGVFGYSTDGDGVVVSVPSTVQKGSDAIRLGDRVRIDRIKPFDRKAGLAGGAYSYDNPDRHLPVERAGRIVTLHLVAQNEQVPNRATALVRVLIYLASVFLGGLLFLMKPGLGTGAFFVFCLGGDYPTTYADGFLDAPWRAIPTWIGDTLRGAAAPALLLFAISAVDELAARERLAAIVLAAVGLALGTLHAYGDWLLTFGARPAQRLDVLYGDATTALTVVTILVFAWTLVRARGVARSRTALILTGFAIAGVARIVSVELHPTHLGPFISAALQTAPIVPIILVWIAVVRHSFFDIDFVVSRGVVFAALTGALIGFVAIVEELASFLFYNNVDVAYAVVIAVGMGFGALLERVKHFLDGIVDRFIFRGRHNQRLALEYIAGYILDAESADDVYRALLQDAPHALNLSFGGIFARQDNGDYVLTQSHDWPQDLDVRLAADDELTRDINRSRSVLTDFSGKDSGAIRRHFPTGRLTFAAPLFAERRVGAIVVYGQNVSGLDLDPDERELLVRVVEHASIALREIELARYRAAVDRLTNRVAIEAAISGPHLGSG